MGEAIPKPKPPPTPSTLPAVEVTYAPTDDPATVERVVAMFRKLLARARSR